MSGRFSLRLRLTIVILAPLLVIAAIIGVWAYGDAQTRAADRFDRSLLSTALAISRDTAVTGGDALSEATRDLLRDTSGGAVFYHVYAPDGVFVTGYATPPVAPLSPDAIPERTYYDAIYQGQPVRALRFTQTMLVDGLQGPFTFTVWQNTRLRDGFVQGRTRPTFLIIASLVGAIAVIVWFGVGLGLHPLSDLENAIAQRSTDDLSPIKRKIPVEVSGIVGRLNDLLDELGETLATKDRFISDAAHQLRNPIAGVLSLAEAVQAAKTPEDARFRSADLVQAARESSALANNLLALERARAAPRGQEVARFDPRPILTGLTDRFARQSADAGVKFIATIPDNLPALAGDAVLFEQAILNPLNNALVHGGPALGRIELSATATAGELVVEVKDNGKGVDAADFHRALARFGQVEPSSGSGLGLPISEAIVATFGGSIALERTENHFIVRLTFRDPG